MKKFYEFVMVCGVAVLCASATGCIVENNNFKSYHGQKIGEIHITQGGKDADLFIVSIEGRKHFVTRSAGGATAIGAEVPSETLTKLTSRDSDKAEFIQLD